MEWPARRGREEAYLAYFRLTGRSLGRVFRELRADDLRRDAVSDVPRRLAATLAHAAAHVPYYAPILEGRVEEATQDPEAVLAELPILTKDLIRAHYDDLCSDDIAERKTYVKASGGSTGEPVQLIQDMHFRDYDNAVQMLMSSWAGWKPAEPEVVIVGSERDLHENDISFQSRVANWLMRRTYFNAFQMSEETIRACLAALDRDPPRLIRGYHQSLNDLASFAQREGVSIAPQNAILGTAGMLYPSMRERIESVFGCPVFDQYGSREASAIGCECEHHQGLHVFPWMNYVEIVDEEGAPTEPGVEGKVLVTSLCNLAMPLIRYEIGDRAVLVPDDAPPCPCGRRGPRIAKVLGRTVDTFKALNGSLVHGAYFISLLDSYEALSRFQVVQGTPGSLNFRLLTCDSMPEEALADIARGAREAMGEACRVEFDFVDEIAPSDSGKYRYTICEC